MGYRSALKIKGNRNCAKLVVQRYAVLVYRMLLYSLSVKDSRTKEIYRVILKQIEELILSGIVKTQYDGQDYFESWDVVWKSVYGSEYNGPLKGEIC